MSLLSLPNELILLIARELEPKSSHCTPKHLTRLLRVNRRFAALLTETVHKIALQDKGNLSALAWAANLGHKTLVRLALDNGADVNAATEKGTCFYTPLLWAVEGGHVDIVRILIEGGAEVNLGVPKFTPLHLAAERDNLTIIKLLLQRGANTELREDVGLTPLLITRCEMVARLLLDHGADIDAVTRMGGMTALHIAAMMDDEQFVRLLLERGASVTITDSSGKTPRDMAKGREFEKYFVERDGETACASNAPESSSSPISLRPIDDDELGFGAGHGRLIDWGLADLDGIIA